MDISGIYRIISYRGPSDSNNNRAGRKSLGAVWAVLGGARRVQTGRKARSKTEQGRARQGKAMRLLG